MKAIKKNMRDHISDGDKKILHCKICGAEYSGNRGDYWYLPDDHIFECCNAPMELVEKQTTIKYK